MVSLLTDSVNLLIIQLVLLSLVNQVPTASTHSISFSTRVLI